MTWLALHAEVSSMFDEYTWREDDRQLSLESYVARIMAERAEYAQSPVRKLQLARARDAWRARNPEQWKKSQRERTKRWRKKKRKELRAVRALKAKEREKQKRHQERLLAHKRDRLAPAKDELRRRMEARRAA